MTARRLLRTDNVTIDPASARKQQYAEGALTLQENHSVPGAEGLFNQALTNGLLVVASAVNVIPTTGGKLPAARQLIVLLRGTVNDGILDTLDQAVMRTDGARHGRTSGSTLVTGDVEALIELGNEPSLAGSLTEEQVDRDYVRAYAADRNEQSRALDYLQLIIQELGEEEVDRRAEAAEGVGSPYPGDVGDEPQECPVCERVTLAVTSTDEFGHGIGAGTCAVCSYWRSPDLLYWLGMHAELDRVMSRDD